MDSPEKTPAKKNSDEGSFLITFAKQAPSIIEMLSWNGINKELITSISDNLNIFIKIKQAAPKIKSLKSMEFAFMSMARDWPLWAKS